MFFGKSDFDHTNKDTLLTKEKPMRFLLITMFALAALVPFASEADAQNKVTVIKGKDRVMYKKKTVIDFEDNTVEGELVKPEGGYMVNRARAKFNSLITIRSHFVREMFQNARKL